MDHTPTEGSVFKNIWVTKIGLGIKVHAITPKKNIFLRQFINLLTSYQWIILVMEVNISIFTITFK